MNNHKKTESSSSIEVNDNTIQMSTKQQQQKEELNKHKSDNYESDNNLEATPSNVNVSLKSNDEKQIITVTQSPNDLNVLPQQGSFSHYKGGYLAHLFRRIWHVSIFAVIPIIYYWCIEDFAKLFGPTVTPAKILSIIIILQIILEGLRIYKGIIIFGMREYERKQICAQTWGTISACIVFLLAYPRAFSTQSQIVFDTNNNYNLENACKAQIALPIIWNLGFGDPLIGELKRLGVSLPIRTTIAIITLTILYIIAYLWCNTPWWLCLIMPTIAVAAEYPSLKIIDDNGMMLLIPLLVSVILEPWYSHTCTNSTFYSNS